MTFNYYSILFDIIFQNRIYFYSLNEELIFGSLFLLLSFVVVVTGNQSPTDVHVVPEPTASLWPFSGRTERCVSLEIPSVVHTVSGAWEDLSVLGSCFLWLHREYFLSFIYLLTCTTLPLKLHLMFPVFTNFHSTHILCVTNSSCVCCLDTCNCR